MMSTKRLPFQWLLPGVFFLIGLMYLYASPHFESPDSSHHVGVIKWIADHGGSLPVMTPEHDHLHDHEAGQPPLYYLLTLPIWLAADTTDFDDFYNPNPLAIAGHPARLGNRNKIFYEQPHPPNLSGVSLALYAVRLLTLCMSTVSVFAVFQAARTIRPYSTGFALLTTTFVAFNPQFLFISTSVSNDCLVTMLTSLTLWQLLEMLRDGFSVRRSLLLAVLVSLATLSKLSGLTMVLVVAGAGVWLAIIRRDLKSLVTLAGSMLLAWLLIASWWFWRNLALYRDFFGATALAEYHGGRTTSLGRLLVEEFEGFRRSYWGLFGWFSNFTNDYHYVAMDIVTVAALAGLAVFLVKHRKQEFQITAFTVVAMTTVVGAGAVVWYTLQTTASQGRLMFPYIAAISTLMAMGLTALRIPPLLIIAPMLIFSVIAPFRYIIPTYDHPPQVAQVPPSAILTFAQWDDVTLIGHEVPPPQRWSGGDQIPITLYWRPLAQSEHLLALFITLLDRDGRALATIDSFPGWGTLPTTWWQPDAIYRDDYILQIPEDAMGFSPLRLHIGWHAWPDGSNIKPTLENGAMESSYFIPVGALVARPDAPRIPDDATADGTVFGDNIRLDAYRWRDGKVLELYWHLVDELGGDWRVFAVAFAHDYRHNEDNQILLQRDAAPAVPLDYLRAGEAFATVHEFEVDAETAGERNVYIGWYDHTAGVRLPLPYPANMLPLPAFNFSPSVAP